MPRPTRTSGSSASAPALDQLRGAMWDWSALRPGRESEGARLAGEIRRLTEQKQAAGEHAEALSRRITALERTIETTQVGATRAAAQAEVEIVRSQQADSARVWQGHSERWHRLTTDIQTLVQRHNAILMALLDGYELVPPGVRVTLTTARIAALTQESIRLVGPRQPEDDHPRRSPAPPQTFRGPASWSQPTPAMRSAGLLVAMEGRPRRKIVVSEED